MLEAALWATAISAAILAVLAALLVRETYADRERRLRDDIELELRRKGKWGGA